jgi:hypothetical protein
MVNSISCGLKELRAFKGFNLSDMFDGIKMPLLTHTLILGCFMDMKLQIFFRLCPSDLVSLKAAVITGRLLLTFVAT